MVSQAATIDCPKLRPILGYLEGLSARAELKKLYELLTDADIAREDIEEVCVFGTGAYRRNVIGRGAWYEILALCWRSGQCSPIHDHKGAACAFKVIEGEGTEIVFELTECGLICPAQTRKMPRGYVCASGEADIHEVANMQAPGKDLITLHIYSPFLQSMNTYSMTSTKRGTYGGDGEMAS